MVLAAPAAVAGVALEAWEEKKLREQQSLEQRQLPGLCSPDGLKLVHCPDEENGVSWQYFLALACQHCPVVGEPCEYQPASDKLAAMAQDIVVRSNVQAFSCGYGVMTAMIVSAQYFLVSDDMMGSDVESFMERGALLLPFPFNTLQYSMFKNMVPARYTLCDGTLSRQLNNTFVPRVHPENTGRCGMVYDDEVLVRKCRTRRISRSTPADRKDFLASLRCPDPATANISTETEPELAQKVRKYSERAADPARQCQSSRGMWREPMSDVHKCVLITVGHLLNFRPGQLMLDWGSGCGHKLTWAKLLFDVDGVGLDLEQGAVAWAKRHSIGTYCAGDGRDLRWVPDGAFDYVFSYAALYHLPKLDQCRTGISLIYKLRVGGKAYFGWNKGYAMSNWEWKNCFTHPHMVEDMTPEDMERSRGIEVDMEAVEDAFLFPPSTTSASNHYLYQYPAYSLLITRLA